MTRRHPRYEMPPPAPPNPIQRGGGPPSWAIVVIGLANVAAYGWMLWEMW